MTQNPELRAGTPISLAGLRAGTEVGGYRLVRRLGAGGMGVVWEVTDASGHNMAMKILHPQIAADPMARRRLDREASVLARVKDTRVARILDIETGDGADGTGVTFVITELVDGPTLQYEVDHEGVYDLSTDARDLADLAHGLVDALSAVHDAGVIHRDLKPSNVMLGAQGPVLIDFGIAQVADDVRLTQTGQVTGTPGFIPPEMLDGDEPSPGVDWYACAGVLLFTITGRAPFGSGPWQAVFRRVYAGTPELGDLEEESPALARAFKAALAPNQKDRLPIEDLLRVLDEVADGGTGENALAEAHAEDLAQEAARDTGTFGMAYDASAAPSSAPPGAYGYLSAPGTGSTPGQSGPSAGTPGPEASPGALAYGGAQSGTGSAGGGPDASGRIPPSFSPSSGAVNASEASAGAVNASEASAHEAAVAQSAPGAAHGQAVPPQGGPGLPGPQSGAHAAHMGPSQATAAQRPGLGEPEQSGSHASRQVPPIQQPGWPGVGRPGPGVSGQYAGRPGPGQSGVGRPGPGVSGQYAGRPGPGRQGPASPVPQTAQSGLSAQHAAAPARQAVPAQQPAPSQQTAASGTPQHPGAQRPGATDRPAPGQQGPRTGPAPQRSVPQAASPQSAKPAGTAQPSPSTASAESAGPAPLAGAASGRANLPEWALPPRRHSGVIAATAVLCLALSVLVPFWVALATTGLMALVGTVGRAEDAMRWRRLQAGQTSSSDRSRMWAGVPWYFLRSLVGTLTAALLSCGFSMIVFYLGAQIMGWGNDPSSRFLGSLTDYHRAGLFMVVIVGIYLTLTWFMPWAASTRRGGARTVELILGGASGRLIAVVVMLAISLAVFLLFAVSVLPVVNFQPVASFIK